MAAAGGDIVLGVAIGTQFKTKTIIALLVRATFVLEPALATTATMFDNRAVAGCFAPKQIGETAGGTEDLYRLAPCAGFVCPTSGE